MSYIPPLLGGGGLGGVQLALAGVYESRVHTVSRLVVPRAQFAGDTNVTATDGSFNTRPAGTNAAIPKSATAFLANTTNTYNSTDQSSLGKPLIIKVKRDEFTSEIKSYGVFNADGTVPGGTIVLTTNAASGTGTNTLSFASTAGLFAGDQVTIGTQNFTIQSLNATTVTLSGNMSPGVASGDPITFNAGTNSDMYPYNLNARYRVNTTTGEIYLRNPVRLRSLNNIDGTIARILARTGTDGVIGMVEFEALQGGAMSSAQQQAAELSGVIQSLTSILRSINDGKKGILSIIK